MVCKGNKKRSINQIYRDLCCKVSNFFVSLHLQRTGSIMPRKTNGIPFKLHPGPKKGEDGKPLLYAQIVTRQKVNVNDIDEFCTNYRHTSSGEIKLMFSLLRDVTSMWLSRGYRVETPFGTIVPKLKLPGEYTEPDQVRGRAVLYDGVEFTPSKQFIADSDCSREGFRLVRDSVGNSQKDDPKAMEAALKQSARNGYVTIKKFMIFSGLKYNSAKAYLDSLCEGDNPRLERYREGRTLHYAILSDKPIGQK